MCWQRHEQVDWWSAEAEPRRSDVRVSDADRHAVIDELQRHTADGRLTLDEFEERVDEALRARTGADLDAVTRELPSMTPRADRRHRGARAPFRPGAIAVCVVAALLVLGFWWVLIPLGFFVFGGCGRHEPSRSSRQDDARDDTTVYA